MHLISLRRCAVFAVALCGLLTTANPASAGALYLLDTFDRPNSNTVTGAVGQSGLIAPATYVEYNPATIRNNQLLAAGNFTGEGSELYGSITPNYNFNTASGIASGGGFRISFDGNPGIGSNGQLNSWVGISMGHSFATNQRYGGDLDPLTSFFIIFRDNGRVDSSANHTTGYSGIYDSPTPGLDESYSYELTVLTSAITAGGAASVSVKVNGAAVALGGAGVYSVPFAWSNNSNFMMLAASVSSQTFIDTSWIDNFKIESIDVPAGEVPEPSTFLLGLLGVAGVPWLRRRIVAACS